MMLIVDICCLNRWQRCARKQTVWNRSTQTMHQRYNLRRKRSLTTGRTFVQRSVIRLHQSHVSASMLYPENGCWNHTIDFTAISYAFLMGYCLGENFMQRILWNVTFIIHYSLLFVLYTFYCHAVSHMIFHQETN